MKKVFSIPLVVTSILLMATGSSLAFHGGGVGPCNGCHSMHQGHGQSQDLLKGVDPSSTCLNCHNGAGGYRISSEDGSNVNEGGDFHWVKDNGYAYVMDEIPIRVDYNNFGHSIVAAEYDLIADENLVTAPGGTYPSSDLGCHSCHDPHGQVAGGTGLGGAPISVSGSYGSVPPNGTIPGNYRLLRDSGWLGFTESAPIARADSFAGVSTQYGSGMSSWCANCHESFYSLSAGGGMHPTDIAPPLEYNRYVATGDFTGNIATAYDPLVPIERGVMTGSYDLPDPTDQITAAYGVDGASRVMCLSCHRAHASAFENALRWDTTTEYISETWIDLANYTAPVAGLAPPATAVPYYKHGLKIDIENPGVGQPFTDGYGTYQRSLCNKCHVKD